MFLTLISKVCIFWLDKTKVAVVSDELTHVIV